MSHFRLRWKKLGGHVHVSVWAGTSQVTTHGKNGDLIFTEQEWDDFVVLLQPKRYGIDVPADRYVEIEEAWQREEVER